MIRIRRYTLPDGEPFLMPAAARLMKLELYFGCMNVWALVDESQPNVPVVLRSFATDEVVPDDAVFINTVVVHEMENGQQAQHWFMLA